jgi:hypothetical protein
MLGTSGRAALSGEEGLRQSKAQVEILQGIAVCVFFVFRSSLVAPECRQG